jgi:hypothetical protein
MEVLVVGKALPADLRGPLEGTLRALRDVTTPDALRGRYALEEGPLLRLVLVVDPLPTGKVERFLPLCGFRGLEDPNCSPSMWMTTAAAERKSGVYEGWLTARHDERLRVKVPEMSVDTATPRILDLDVPLQGRPTSGAKLAVAVGVAVLACLLACLLTWVRARGRPVAEAA